MPTTTTGTARADLAGDTMPSVGGTATGGGAADVVGGATGLLDEAGVRSFVERSLGSAGLDGRSVCVLVPDGTRRCPLALLLSAVHGALHGRASRITVLVALGTHAPMPEAARAAHLGYPAGDVPAAYPGTTVADHAWWEPAELRRAGTVAARRVAELSDGMLAVDVAVEVNRAVLEHDVTLVVGPVLPHEVVGFSGGNKYLFPGVSGRQLVDVSHWLGALITSERIIGVEGTTPVRALIDDAAAMLPVGLLALCAVTEADGDGLHALTFGHPVAAWRAAASTSAQVHVRRLDAPVRRVLSIVPGRYDDLWTGAKGFYKVEPVVADGGEVVLLAPHITEISATHPAIARIGYHCRDYFVKQWDRFRHEAWGDLAHSTHLRGAGTWDAETGERPRVRVTLATGIPEAVVRSVGLDHLDPATVDPGAWAAEPGTLVVPDAGENLYRLR